MPRNPPIAPPGAFSRDVLVRSTDVDPIGHANNIVYVQWLQDIAIAHSHGVGLDWEAYQTLGAIFVVRKHEIEYLSPSLDGEKLRVVTWISETRGAISMRRTLFYRADASLGAEANTTWVLRDFRSGRPRRIPPELAARFDLAPPSSAS